MPRTREIGELRNELVRRKTKDISWASLAEEYGVHRAVLWRIAFDNYEPKRPDLRKQLRLPQVLTQTARRDEGGRFARRTQ